MFLLTGEFSKPIRHNKKDTVLKSKLLVLKIVYFFVLLIFSKNIWICL